MTTQGERITAVEVQVKELKDQFLDHKNRTEKNFESVNEKLDELLTLRSKGVGAFWLASTVLGTGIVGGLAALFNWLFHS